MEENQTHVRTIVKDNNDDGDGRKMRQGLGFGKTIDRKQTTKESLQNRDSPSLTFFFFSLPFFLSLFVCVLLYVNNFY